MSQFRTIEIDFEVHRCIENERRGFDEHPNVALRRLLKLSALKPISPAAIVQSHSNGRPWTEQGVALPHGTLVRMIYDRGRQKHEGRIEDGRLRFGSRNFDSVSGAASDLAVTKKGKKTNLNGWRYFQYKDSETGRWVSFDDLRRNHAALSPEDMGL